MIGENYIAGSHRIDKGKCMSYDDFKSLPILEEGRKNKLCVITSNKKFTCGHRRRVEFVERLKKEYIDYMTIKKIPTTHGAVVFEPEIPYKQYFSMIDQKM